MKTPQQVRAIQTDSDKDPRSPWAQFEAKIDAALERAAKDGHWPVTIALTGVSGRVAAAIAKKCELVGWRASVVADQRDGDFLQIEEP